MLYECVFLFMLVNLVIDEVLASLSCCAVSTCKSSLCLKGRIDDSRYAKTKQNIAKQKEAKGEDSDERISDFGCWISSLTTTTKMRFCDSTDALIRGKMCRPFISPWDNNPAAGAILTCGSAICVKL